MITNFTNGVLFVSFALIRAIRFYFLSNQRAKGSFPELSQNETKGLRTLGFQKHSLSSGIFQEENEKKAQVNLTWALNRPTSGDYFISLHFPYFSLKIRWRIFPVGVMGISSSLMKSTDLGILYPAILPLQ